ncbi:hypothetical protein MBLNU459_g0201t1 [Dothideomycetes sp. NU459]
MSISSPRTIALCIFLFLASALVTLSFRSTGRTSTHWPSKHGSVATHSASQNNKARVAFATFLAGNANPGKEADDEASAAINDRDDGYFQGARVLAYQLLHSPTAGTNASIPFLVLVTADVSERKRQRLRLDGATVVPVDKLAADWVHPANARWADVMTKLRLFELVQFAKICFVDADTLVTRRLDGVFHDEATLLQQHTLADPRAVRPDEAALPRTYMLATHADYWGYDHAFPPVNAAADYLNCGFFVFAPSRRLFDYYLSLLRLPGRFDPAFPEQNLLNYAHRRDGNMPWKPLWYGWNVNWPTERDWKGGAASFHAKYWDGDPSHDPVLKAIWREQRAEMEGFQRGRDLALGR